MTNVDGMFNATFDNGHQYHNSVARGFLKRWKIELPPRLLVGQSDDKGGFGLPYFFLSYWLNDTVILDILKDYWENKND